MVHRLYWGITPEFDVRDSHVRTQQCTEESAFCYLTYSNGHVLVEQCCERPRCTPNLLYSSMGTKRQTKRGTRIRQ